MVYTFRNFAAAIVGSALRKSPFRFSKDYRWGTTRRHRIVYAMVNTVAANYVADGEDPRVAIFWGYARQSRYVRKG